MPLVSIVIPVHNKVEFTRRCLESVRSLTYPEFNVWMVDNGSSDGTAEIVAKEFPWVRIIKSPSNLGYAGGCNLGIRSSDGDAILLLNNDTMIVDPGLLAGLVEAMESNPRIGAVGPRIVEYDDHTKTIFDGRGDALGFLPVTGVVLLLRRRALEDVGLLDESFFAYYEDRDLFARLGKAGWELRHVNSVSVAHKGSVTAVPDSPFYLYYHNRNLLVLMRRHASLSHLLFRVMPKWLELTAWSFRNALRRGDKAVLEAWIRGHVDGIRAALADQPRHGPPLGVARPPPPDGQSSPPLP